MKEFIDGKNRIWSISLTIASAKRIRDLAEFNIADPENPNILINLMSNPILIADIGWAMIHPQALEKNIDANDFGESLDGDRIECLCDIILEEYVNFSGSRTRPATLKKIETMRKMEKRTNELMIGKMDNLKFEDIKPEVLRMMSSGAVAIALQESLESNLAG